MQVLQLVSDVHTLADQVRAKCGTKTPDASGGLTPRYSLNSPSKDQVLLSCSGSFGKGLSLAGNVHIVPHGHEKPCWH